MTSLKTVLVDALNGSAMSIFTLVIPHGDQIVVHDSPEYGVNVQVEFDLDRLATAVRDHFLDREKVGAAVLQAYSIAMAEKNMTGVREISLETLVTELIAGLAGGSE